MVAGTHCLLCEQLQLVSFARDCHGALQALVHERRSCTHTCAQIPLSPEGMLTEQTKA